jgi:cytochrome c biogenesis protein CcdA
MFVLAFSVAAMVAFGGIVVTSALRSPQEGRRGFALVSRTPHMLGYAAMGLFVAIGAAPNSGPDGLRRQA